MACRRILKASEIGMPAVVKWWVLDGRRWRREMLGGGLGACGLVLIGLGKALGGICGGGLAVAFRRCCCHFDRFSTFFFRF